MSFPHHDLLAIQDRLSTPRRRAELEELARALPGLDGLSPEVALLLADLHLRLWPWRAAPLPDWRAARLPALVEIAWLRTEISADPGAIAREPYGERLLRALELDGERPVADPPAHVRALTSRPEEALQRLAVERARRFLHEGAILPAEARAVLVTLAWSEHVDVAADALSELAQPWCRLLPRPDVRVFELFGRETRTATAALDCAASWGLDAPLRGAIESDLLAPARRALAIRAYGSVASRDAFPAVIDIAAGDPLAFGPALLDFLRRQHRRAHFVRPEEVPGLVRVFLGNHELDAKEVAALAFPVRRELATALLDAPEDDPTWPRRAPLLVAIATGPQGSTPVEVAEPLTKILELTTAPAVRRALLGAIGALRHEAAEPAVLALLETEPDDALRALRAIGGKATIGALGKVIDLEGVAPALRAHWERAVTLAWRLSEVEPAEREALRERLRAERQENLPPKIRALLAVKDTSARLHALGDVVREDADASFFLARVAPLAGPLDLPLVLDLLLRVASELDRGELVNSAEYGDEARTLPAPVRDAVGAIGRRLVEAGSIRPRELLDLQRDGAAGATVERAFVSTCARRLLERSDLTDGETFALLKALDPAADPRAAPILARMLRRPEPQLRKVIVALLAKHGADDVLASLTRLTDEDDIQTVRQAIDAIGAVGPRAASSAEALAACLDHRNMNIKKSAAEALASTGGPEAVPKLLYWIGHHDNPGFRTSLARALGTILGGAYVATIVAALASLAPGGGHDAERTRGFLVAALDEKLSFATARALCLRDDALGARLKHELFTGAIALASDPAGARRAALRLELDVYAPGPRGDDDGAAPAEIAPADLLLNGFTESAARAFLARREDWKPVDLEAARPFWNSWIELAATSSTDRAAALALVAKLADVSAPAEAERAILSRHHERLLEAIRDAPLETEVDFWTPFFALLAIALRPLDAPARLAIAAALRALPERPNLSGREPFALLRACGALLTRADLDRALREAKRTRDPAALEREALTSAFGTAGAAPLDAERAETLRKAARAPDGRALVALRARFADVRNDAMLRALFDVFPDAFEPARPALLDWMESVQPLSAPTWHLVDHAAEDLARRAREHARIASATDLDQPRSAALGARLVAMLSAPEPRERARAARVLASWPEPRYQAALAEAYVRGAIDGSPTAKMAAALLESAPIDVAQAPVRMFALLARAPAASIAALAPALLDRHRATSEPDDDRVRRAIEDVLRVLGSDALVPLLAPRLLAGEWALGGILGSPTRRTPELDRVRERAVLEGRRDSAERLGAIVAPTKHDDPSAFAAALAEIRVRRPALAGSTEPTVGREELFKQASSRDVPVARRALTLLAEAPDARLVALLHALLDREQPQIRLHAHRLLRACVPRDEYLVASMKLLDDPLDDVRRSAIRIVGFARHEPAIPRLVELLADESVPVRRAAKEAIVGFGTLARPALKRAASKARPDRRGVFEEALDTLERD